MRLGLKDAAISILVDVKSVRIRSKSDEHLILGWEIMYFKRIFSIDFDLRLRYYRWKRKSPKEKQGSPWSH